MSKAKEININTRKYLESYGDDNAKLKFYLPTYINFTSYSI